MNQNILNSGKINFVFTEHIVDLYNDKKFFMRAEYEILGCYNNTTSIWIWGYALDYIDRDLTLESRKIKKHVKKKIPVNKTDETHMYYGLNPVFYLSKENVDNLIGMCRNIIDYVHIIPHHNTNITLYVVIKKILQEKN